MQEQNYWWCATCNLNVDVLIAYSVGIFCIICGDKVTKPDNLKDVIVPIEWDNDIWREIEDEDLRTI